MPNMAAERGLESVLRKRGTKIALYALRADRWISQRPDK